MKKRAFLLATSLACMSAHALDYSAQAIHWRPADGSIQGAAPMAGQDIFITCAWSSSSTPGEKFKFNSDMVGQIYVDGKPVGPPRMGVSSNGITTSSEWHASAGTHTVRCMVDSTHLVAESNESNNSKQIQLIVGSAGIARPVQGGTVAGAGTAVHLPNGKSRACKATVWSTVALDAAQFAPLEGAPEMNPLKMTLDLAGSSAMGNYVHCEYHSVRREVKLMYTLKCPNAHPAGPKHTYACDMSQ